VYNSSVKFPLMMSLSRFSAPGRRSAGGFWAGLSGAAQDDAAWTFRRKEERVASVVVAVSSRKASKMPVRKRSVIVGVQL
jgi:hypothetical protein